MYETLKITAIASVLALSVSGATAQGTTELVEQLGEWGLYFNSERGGNCLIARVDGAGRTWQIGADREKEQAYLGVLAETGGDVEAVSLSEATIDLDGNLYEGEVREFTNRAGIHGAYVWFNNLDFAYDIANAQTLKATMDDGRETSLDLTGSKEAMEWALACQIATTQ